MTEGRYLGLDVGTSGVRGCLLDGEGQCRAMAEQGVGAARRDGAVHERDPEAVWQAVVAVTAELADRAGAEAIVAVAVDGTSGTLIPTDGAGAPLTPALLYDDARARQAAARLAEIGPRESGAHGPTSGLAKLIHLLAENRLAEARWALHEADWVTARLTGQFGVTDENNALKLGYDPVARQWPAWVTELVPAGLLPRVVSPGTRLGGLGKQAAAATGLAPATPVHAGTTDSVAAFLATGASEPGEAVTSLGSTLALKVVSATPVFDPPSGVYSHRLGERWLAGGASNSGGAVLAQFFTSEELTALTPRLDPDRPTGLDYYPLPGKGERFPYRDPDMAPRLEPRPDDGTRFLQGLLEGMAGIEAAGYRHLADLGAPYPQAVRTVGGGAQNPAWSEIRQRALGVPLAAPDLGEAACGAGLLALRGEP